jgi:hypothetical protein
VYDSGAPVNYLRDYETGSTALHIIAQNYFHSQVKISEKDAKIIITLLIDAGINRTLKAKNGTAAEYASNPDYGNNPAIAKFINDYVPKDENGEGNGFSLTVAENNKAPLAPGGGAAPAPTKSKWSLWGGRRKTKAKGKGKGKRKTKGKGRGKK